MAELGVLGAPSAPRNRAAHTAPPMAQVAGQNSFLLRSDLVDMAIARMGGMMGPVTFFPGSESSIQPYAVAPWNDSDLPPDSPNVLKGLRGSWFCSAFGNNVMLCNGHRLPVHGETANNGWDAVNYRWTDAGCWLQLETPMPLQGGKCRATTALLNGQSVIYLRHDLTELNGPINPGHHTVLAFPDTPHCARLSFSRLAYATTYTEPVERPEQGGYSWLQHGREIVDIHAVPCIDGSTTDLCAYPARRGFEDIALLCADPVLSLGWSAAAVPSAGYVWFSLRRTAHFASTHLWFSNGGRHFAPWNGRHVNVLGIEDVTAYFHDGIMESRAANPVSERGIATCIQPDQDGSLSLCQIQGVASIPPTFDEVADIRCVEPDSISLLAKSGESVTVRCDHKFLQTGSLTAMAII